MTDNYPTEGEKAIARDEAAAVTSVADLLDLAASHDREAAAARARAASLTAALEAARRPKMPALGGAGDAAVVRFAKYQNGRTYNYAAIGWVAGTSGATKVIRWAVTGQEGRRFNWSGLLDFIGEANWPTLYEMTEHRLLGPDVEHESPLAQTMGDYGRVVSTGPVYSDGGLVRGSILTGHNRY